MEVALSIKHTVDRNEPRCSAQQTLARMALDAIFWVTSAASQPWLQNTGLALTDDGFVAVGGTLTH